jgi:threonine dehydrogenase-like Zn-dependent dehydrogenase
MGRAPARRVFNDALDVLVANSDKVRKFVTHKLPISEAAKGYEIFEKQLARKVVLVF